MECKLDNGHVIMGFSGCSICQYECDPGYFKASFGPVYCNTISGKWRLFDDEYQPCILEYTYITPMQTLPTVLPATKVPDVHNIVVVSTSVTGGVIGLVLLLIIIRLCLRIVFRRQLASGPRIAMPSERANAMEVRRMEECPRRLVRDQDEYIGRQNEYIRGQYATVSAPDNDNHSSFIFRIRRFFKINRNPYRTFQNTTEPPPYDAESFTPPTYEESQEATRVTSTLFQPVGVATVNRSEDPPPPYGTV